jgi:GTP-binding protein
VPPETVILAISSLSGQGVPELLREVKSLIDQQKQRSSDDVSEKEIPVYKLDSQSSWRVEKTKGVYLVSGEKIEKFARKTDFSNEWGVRRLRDIMRKMGIYHELQRLGIKSGDRIAFKDCDGKLKY